MLRELTAKLPAHAVETLPVPSAENSAPACAQSAIAASLTQSRNRARNNRCGNPVAAQHCAHMHLPPQSDLVAVLNLLQRTSSKPLESAHSGRPKSFPADCS